MYVVRWAGPIHTTCSFGYIPNVELMKFISLATFGSYLSSCPEPDLANQNMNTYHKAFLTYSFLKTSESMNPEYYCGKKEYGILSIFHSRIVVRHYSFAQCPELIQWCKQGCRQGFWAPMKDMTLGENER